MEKYTSEKITGAVSKAYKTHIAKMADIYEETFQVIEESQEETSTNLNVMLMAMMIAVQQTSAVILNATLNELFGETEYKDNE